MIQVSLISPSAIVYKVDDPTSVISATAPQGMPMRYFGVIIADSVPIDLLAVQRKQIVAASWKLVVTDGRNTYEFTKVWFNAIGYPASGEVGKFRIDFGSQTGPRNVKLISP